MSNVRNFAGRFAALVAGLAISSALGPILAAPIGDRPAADHAIRLSNASFRPGLGERPAIPPGLSISGYAQDQLGYYIVQFDGPVRPEWKSAAEAEGAELLEYVPDFAFKTRMSPGQAKRVEALDDVVWVGLFQPAFKLRPRMLQGEGEELYRVRVHRGADAASARSQAHAAGADPTEGSGRVFLVRADAERLEALANILEIGWIERYELAELHNEYASGIIKADVANANGYDGSGQIVAISDTGLGTGTAAGGHPGISSGRIKAIFDWVGADDPICWDVIDDGPHDPNSGHGTHVAVSAVGAGNTAGLGRGSAPGAQLVFQAVENLAYFVGLCFGNPPGYILTGIPYDIRGLFQQAYDEGARVHSNSWGTTAYAGLYDIDSYFVDEFIWSNKDMTIAYSAGNSSEDWNWNGYVNPADPTEDRYYVSTPATAKNLITVGASEGDREGHYECDPVSTAYCDEEGMNALFTYGWGWAVQFGGPGPIASDLTAGNKEQMAGFSSRGPTHDYRLKPDVVAPGTWILSGYSDMYQQYYDPAPDPETGAWQSPGWFGPKDIEYKYAGGTSMATPIVAGGAAIVRQYYQSTSGHSASAALVKGTLINSADDLLDENNDGSDDNDIPIPNNHEGWGRINLDAATDGSHVFEDVTPGVQTGGSANYQYTVETGGSPFKVSLVWSDFPSSETAATNLVNDLDLEVVAPGGTTYKGNVFAGGWSQTGGTADRINNVENVYVQAAAAGSWSVTVSGYNVPNGPQPFALVVDGGTGSGSSTDFPPSVGITSPADGETVSNSFDITADASDDDGVTQLEFFVDDVTVGIDVNGIDGWSTNWNSMDVEDGGHVISAIATDTAGQTRSHSVGVTVNNSGPSSASTLHVSDLDGSSIDQGKGKWRATVGIEVRDDLGSASSGVTVNGTWAGGSTESAVCSTGGNGRCDVFTDIRNKFPAASFTVTGLSHATLGYDPAANEDADADSDGTTIDVFKDGGGSEPPPPPTGGPTMHVGDLDGSSLSAPRNRWSGTVEIYVHDEGHSPLGGMTVSGSWSAGGGGSCSTDSNGYCAVTRSNIKGNVGSTTFSVTDVVDGGNTYVYAPGGAVPSHDPDGDSDGISITISRP
jgi:subtilisin family serine protease